jgi:hypothetical protein
MKHYFAILAILFSSLSFAQEKLSREQKKQLKSELKSYRKDLAGYKARKEANAKEREELKSSNQKLTDDLAGCNSTLAEMSNKIAALQATIQELEKRPVSCPVDISKTPMGTIYKVQMGFFKNLSIIALLEQAKAFSAEKVNGINRYVVGSFTSEEEANQLVKDIRVLGIRGAFVSKYVDGQRIFEWEKNPKYKGKKAPASLEEHLGQ